MPWQVLIILHSLVAATSVLVIKKLSSNGNKYVYSVLFFSFLVEWIAGLAAALIIGGSIIPNWSLQLIAQLALGGVCFGLVSFLFFEVYSRVPASVGSITTTLNRVLAVALAVVILGETLTISQVFGAVLVLLSVSIVSYHRKRKKLTLTYLRSLLIVLIMAVLYGVGTVNEKHLLDSMGVSSYLIFGWAFQLVAVAILVYAQRSKWRMPSRKIAPLFWSQVVLFGMSGGLFIASLVQSDSTSKTVASAGLKVVLSVVLAFIILKERKHVKRISFATVLVIIGIYLLMQ